MKALEPVLSDLVPTAYTEVWPQVRFQLARGDVRSLRAEGLSAQQLRDIVSRSAKIGSHSAEAADFFGRTEITGRTLAQIKESWMEYSPGEDAAWHDSCCDQIARVVRGEMRLVPQAPIREPGSNSEFIPNLIRHREQPASDHREFDFCFIDVSNPHAIPVEDRMLRFGDSFASP